MEGPCVNRKIDAVAAHGSNSRSGLRKFKGVAVADLAGGLVPEEVERCLANCPADMAKASQARPDVQSVQVVAEESRGASQVLRDLLKKRE